MRRVVALSLIAAAAVALAPSPLRIRDRLAAGVRRPAAKDYYAFRRENDETVLDRTDEETEVEADDAEAPLVKGQSLYHERHKKEIEDGILSHLTELGLTLKEAAEALMGGHDDDVVAFSETGEYRDLQKHARAMEQEHLQGAPRGPAALQGHVAGGHTLRRLPGLDAAEGLRKRWPSSFELARTMDVPAKIKQMQNGERINTSERRAVLHTALRARARRRAHDVSENVARYTSMLEEAVAHRRRHQGVLRRAGPPAGLRRRRAERAGPVRPRPAALRVCGGGRHRRVVPGPGVRDAGDGGREGAGGGRAARRRALRRERRPRGVRRRDGGPRRDEDPGHRRVQVLDDGGDAAQRPEGAPVDRRRRRREGRAALGAADRARALRGLRVAHGVGRGRGLGRRQRRAPF